MTKQLKSSLIVLIPIILLICGCKRHIAPSSTNHSVVEERQDSIVLNDIKSKPSHNVVSQPDTTPSKDATTDSLPKYYDTFVKLEVNKEKGYEVRRVNELAFVNSSVLDTIRLALLDMSPFVKYENAKIFVEPKNRITLEKGYGKPSLVEGSEAIYRFGYMLIDSLFIEVVGFKYKEYDVREDAERLFKKTGRTQNCKYEYSYPEISDDKYYKYEITDSTIELIDRYNW